MGDEDSESPDPSTFIEQALIETHHLANLTGVEEAKLARRRLVDAQSAARVTKTRDMLQEAVEYLELARMERRDAAKGFERARMLAIRAETVLGGEGHVQNWSIDRLFEPSQWSTGRETLDEIRQEAAVNSYEQLRYEMAMEELFEELRGDHDGKDEDLPDDLSAEEALALAEREFGTGRDDGGFVFLEGDSLASAGE